MMQGERPRASWAPRGILHRYALPLAVLAAGACLWPAGAHVPGAPWVLMAARVERPVRLSRSPDGSLPLGRWRLGAWSAPGRIAAAPRKQSPEERLRELMEGGPIRRYLREDGRSVLAAGFSRREVIDPATGRLKGDPGLLSGVALDSHGTVYCLDGPYVRRVGPGCTLTTIAGRPSTDPYARVLERFLSLDYHGRATDDFDSAPRSPVGDGGPALQADLLAPVGIAFDRQDNLYILDSFGNVRKVDRSGIISTVVLGTGRLRWW